MFGRKMVIAVLAGAWAGMAAGADVPIAGPQDGAFLTPAQRRILEAPSPPSPETPFRFDAPAGPSFTAEQQQAQREAGRGVVPAVLEAFRRGDASCTIPPGDYRFGAERWGHEGPIYPLEFSGLQRDAEHPFTIDATGATFWFDLPDDQAPHAHFCVGFRDCRNIVFRGATIDRATRGHLEGRITQLDFEGNRIELELSPGISVPTQFGNSLEQRVLPFKADGRFCAPLYALQRGGVHLKYAGVETGRAPGRVYIRMGDDRLLATVRDPAWTNACGDLGTLREGDGLSCVYTVSAGIELIRCANVTLHGLRVYAPKAWGAETGGEGAHLWKDCYFGPRPGTSQWQGGEGFMFNGTRHGTTLDHVTILHTSDDAANFHGYWSRVRAVEGDRLFFEPHERNRRLLPAGARPGDRLRFYAAETGRPLGEAKALELAPESVRIDGPAAAFAGAVVEWPDHGCAGWTIRNCRWHDNYQRILIQSGPGAIRNCEFVRFGSAVELNFVFPYIEGGIPRDIAIENNTFTDVNPQPQGATIHTHFNTFKSLEVPLADGLAVTGNTFERPGGAAIDLVRVGRGIIARNRIVDPHAGAAAARPDEARRRQAILLRRCEDIRLEGNVMIDAAGRTAPDPVTGGGLLGLESCSGIVLDGRPAGRER